MKDKHWFILYFPILYLTPPLHEMMHVLIGWAFGVSTIKVTLTMTYFKTKGSDLHWFIQHYVWDGYVMMAALSLFCVMLFIYLHLKSLNVKVNWDLIKRDLHIKKA